MTLLEPTYLWLLLLALPLVALFSVRPRRRDVGVASLVLWRGLITPGRAPRRRWGGLTWRQLVSLLLLLLALVAVTLGLARARLAPPARRDVVLVVDVSASMGARVGESTRLGVARQQAERIVRGLGPDDVCWVVAAGGDARVVSGPIPGAYGGEAEHPDWAARLPQELGRADLAGAAELAAALLDTQGGDRSEVWLMTDGDLGGEGTQPLRTLAGRARLVWLRPGEPGSNARARATLESLGGEALALTASVDVNGAEPVRVKPEVWLDGALFLSLPEVMAAPDASMEIVALEVPRPQGGDVTLRLRSHDGLELDDALTWRVPLQRRLRVAKFDPSADRFLSAALSADAGVEEVALGRDCDVVVHTAPLPPGYEGVPRLRLGPGAFEPGLGLVPSGSAVVPGEVRGGAHPLLAGVALEGLLLTKVEVFEADEAWQVRVSGDDAPLVLTREAAPRQVALTFHPSGSDLVLRRAFPLLVANSVRWLAGYSPADPLWVFAGHEDRVPDAAVHPEPTESLLELPDTLGIGEETRGGLTADLVQDPRRSWCLAALALLACETLWFYLRTGIRRRSWAAGIRLAILALAGAALSGPTVPAEAPEPGRAVVLVRDVSSSVDPALTAAALTSAAAALGPGDTLAIVEVGEEAHVARPPSPVPVSPARPLELQASPSRPSSPLEDSNLDRGLRLAPAGFTVGRTPRVVLISDGRACSAPALARQAQHLQALGAGVETVGVGAPPGDDVAIRSLDSVRPWAEEGEGVRVVATVVASIATETTLVLRRTDTRGERTWKRRVRVGADPVEVSFDDRAGGRGLAHYRLTVPADSVPQNDWRELALPVRAGPRALLLEGRLGEGRAVGDALRAAGFALFVQRPSELPAKARELRAWDLLVLVDVPMREGLGADALSEDAQRALLAYAEAGGGVLVVGGERAYGFGGYRGAALDPLLPVHSEPPAAGEMPSVALVLLIDRSASMRGPKLELAKVAAGDAVRSLSTRDMLGIVGFAAQAAWVVSPGPAVDTAGAQARLGLQAAGGGTDLVPALDLARSSLVDTPARVKHMVALTDGIAPRQQELLERARAMRTQGITLSTVALGGDADQSLLAALAEAGGGRHHAALDPQGLPRILVDEALTATRRAARTDPFRPEVVTPAAAVRGIDFAAGPALSGLAPSRLKEGAQLWLRGPAQAPLLASWEVGLGRCAAWTSDGGSRWAHEWIQWAGFARLLRQTARFLAPPPVPLEGGARIEAVSDGGRLLVTVRCRAGRLDVSAEDAGGGVTVAPLRLVGTHTHTATFSVPPGHTRISVRKGPEVFTERGVVSPQPSREYTRRGVDPGLNALNHIAAPTSGGASQRPIASLLWIAACSLLLIEVLLRNPAVSRVAVVD